jgi:L-lactate dehydrogenase complex protein LldG
MDNLDIDGIYANFKEQAELIAARVYRATDPTEAGGLLARIILELQAQKVMAASSRLVDLCLEAAGDCGTTVHRENLRLRAEDADLGITEMDLAIAETGTLVQDSTDPGQRLAATLPAVHVALVRTDRLVPLFGDAIAWLNEKRTRLPGYVSFISGPSRTADIERVLTIGVHGPKQLHVIFVDREGGASGE